MDHSAHDLFWGSWELEGEGLGGSENIVKKAMVLIHYMYLLHDLFVEVRQEVSHRLWDVVVGMISSSVHRRNGHRLFNRWHFHRGNPCN